MSGLVRKPLCISPHFFLLLVIVVLLCDAVTPPQMFVLSENCAFMFALTEVRCSQPPRAGERCGDVCRRIELVRDLSISERHEVLDTASVPRGFLEQILLVHRLFSLAP